MLAGDAGEASPFVRFAFLASLEEAKTLGKQKGWIPKILLLREKRRIIGAAPAYLKLESRGEFVFDFAFADLAMRIGLHYYPKLLVAVPFTPATGRRLLVRPGEDPARVRGALASALIDAAKELGASSVHVNFAKDDDIAALVEAGFVERHGVQFQWHRKEARTFDDYLARFDSKRRNQIKREVRAMEAERVRIELVRGEALDDAHTLALVFELYRSTVEKFAWGHQYLNPAFFRIAQRRMRGMMELVLARDADGAPIGGALNFASDRRLYGRYWGARREVRHLHFNACYYQGVRECLERGLDVFEPGAGGEHKLARGFEPTITKSAHYFVDPRLREPIVRFIERERIAIAEELSAS